MAEPWIRVHANIAEKPVVLRACLALRVGENESIGLLVRLWGACSRLGDNGELASKSDFEIERWAGWRGKRGVFAKWVRETHLDDDGRVNEWDDYAGALESRRANDRERQARLRERRRESLVMSQERHADAPRDESVTSAPARANETKRNETKRESTTHTNNGMRAPKSGALVPTAEEQRILDHYRATHQRRRPGDKDLRAVRRALARGYAADELCEAIDGNAADEWHQKRQKHELEYVLRDNGKIDTFRELGAKAKLPIVDENGHLTARGLEAVST